MATVLRNEVVTKGILWFLFSFFFCLLDDEQTVPHPVTGRNLVAFSIRIKYFNKCADVLRLRDEYSFVFIQFLSGYNSKACQNAFWRWCG